MNYLEALKDRHYVLTASLDTYFFNFYISKMEVFKRKYGTSFCLIIRKNSEDPSAYYCIPFSTCSEVFTEAHLAPNKNPKIRRWLGKIENDLLYVSNCDIRIDVKKYRGNTDFIDGRSETSPMPDSVETDFNEESLSPGQYSEGQLTQIFVNKYERNAAARKKCIDFHGARCAVCRFEFGCFYGVHGKGFIHVHHLVPLSKIKKSYKLDPVKDLRPVCPNCHAMIHRGGDLLQIEELQKMIRSAE